MGEQTMVMVLSALAVVLMMGVTAAWARTSGRWSVVDTIWGLGFIAVAAISAAFGDGLVSRRLLLFVLVVLWAGRLATHIGSRARGHGEDPRYAELKSRKGSIIRAVLLPQGLAMWFVSLPVQIAVASDRPIGWLAYVGVALWLLGVGFESIGDAQLRAFKADPANKGKVMDRGLWSWTRHPNYFGDFAVWWGIWLVAADSGLAGAATVLSPIAMTYFLVVGTGARHLERTMMQRPGYPEYAARTSMFLPRPPRRAAG